MPWKVMLSCMGRIDSAVPLRMSYLPISSKCPLGEMQRTEAVSLSSASEFRHMCTPSPRVCRATEEALSAALAL